MVLPLESGFDALDDVVRDFNDSLKEWKDFSALFKDKSARLFLPRFKAEYHKYVNGSHSHSFTICWELALVGYVVITNYFSDHLEEYFAQLGVKLDISGVVQKGDSANASILLYTQASHD